VSLPAPEDVPLPEVPPPLQIAPSLLFEPLATSAPFGLQPVESVPTPSAPFAPAPVEPQPVESVPTPPAPVEPAAAEAVTVAEPEPVAAAEPAPAPAEAVTAAEPERATLAEPEPAPVEVVTLAEPEPVESAPVTPVPELPLDVVAEQPAGPAPAEQPAPVASAPLPAFSPPIVAASTDLPSPAGPAPSPVQPLAAAEPEPDEPMQHAPPPEPLQPPPPAEPLQPPTFVPPPTASLQLPPLAAPPAEPLLPPPLAPAPEPLQPVPLAPPPEPLLPPLVSAAPPDDSWLASPELPPAPAVSPPVAVHPPVPAADLPPVVAAKVPFWKKEISLSRKPKTAAAPQPVPAAAPVGQTGTPRVPWWKKELSLSRKPKSAAAPQAVPAAAASGDAAAPSVPWWKKELSFSRKVKPATAAVAVPEARTPWWKKQIGGKQPAAPAAVAAGEQTTEVVAQPSVPFWKRELSFGKPKLPSRSEVTRQKESGGGKSSKGAKRLVGLKIGASQLAAARVSNNGVAELEQVARQPLPMGIVVGGELRDPDALAEALKTFFAKNKLPRKGVRLGIANNRIGVRIFDIVGVDEAKQLANAIQFRAQEALPIPLDEAVLDYHVLDESVDDEGRSVKRVLLVVAYKELVERYVGACRKAGITLVGIDLEAFALLRSLSPPTEGGSAALVAVAIGYDRSTFAVSDGRVCEFTRVLEWGGWSLNVALARAFDTAPSEVEALKCSLSLDGSTVPEGVSPEQTATAVETIQRQVQSFARELVSSLQFYQNQPGSLGIGEIVITGGTAGLPGLAAELERLIGVHVRVGDPLARLKVAKRVAAPAQVGSLAVAIGLGIED
jgi:type IV pilus assembly protein PilM